jgi:crotonobetainyl-CoA:carnitine CoA-transferase CaiB-like acyl-CoA transferase
MQERIRRRDEFDAAVQDWVGKTEARTVLARLDAAEVPCGPINSVRDLFQDPGLLMANQHSPADPPLQRFA